jgi:hypothetical protein
MPLTAPPGKLLITRCIEEFQIVTPVGEPLDRILDAAHRCMMLSQRYEPGVTYHLVDEQGNKVDLRKFPTISF